MPRHGGESQYHSGSLRQRTRRSRKNRGRRIQSRKDKVAYATQKRSQEVT